MKISISEWTICLFYLLSVHDPNTTRSCPFSPHVLRDTSAPQLSSRWISESWIPDYCKRGHSTTGLETVMDLTSDRSSSDGQWELRPNLSLCGPFLWRLSRWYPENTSVTLPSQALFHRETWECRILLELHLPNRGGPWEESWQEEKHQDTHLVLCRGKGVVGLILLIVWRFVEVVDHIIEDCLEPPLPVCSRQSPPV